MNIFSAVMFGLGLLVVGWAMPSRERIFHEPEESSSLDYYNWNSNTEGEAMGQQQNYIDLQHFTPQEFGDWWPLMSVDLLQKLDLFRAILGEPVDISPVDGALGRHGGQSDTSQHNVDRWGEVRAADVMPRNVDLGTAYQAALEAGFTGIGLYPEANPRPMLHLDVREADTVAQWSGFRAGSGGWDYRGVGEALA